MNISVQFIIVLAAACVFVAQAAPELRVRTKQQRPTRGFKNVEMMTARGFGKRDRPTRTEQSNTKITFHPKDWPLMVAERFGKRSPNSENYDQEEEMRVTRTAFKPNAKVLIARGYGKRNLFVDNESVYAGEQPEESFWETLEQPAEEMTDARDEKRDRLKIRRDRVVPKTTKQSVESAKEGVKLRHTVDEKKRRKLTKSSPRSVKSMKITKGDKEKLKSTGKKQKSTKSLGSITVDTFTKEMVKNPDFARTVVRRFIDHNLDGYLTEDELLKNTA